MSGRPYPSSGGGGSPGAGTVSRAEPGGSGWAVTSSSQEAAPEEAGPLLLLYCDLDSVAAPLRTVPFLKSQVCLVTYVDCQHH